MPRGRNAMRKRSVRPSPAMVVACVALFVALGGTTLAAAGYVISSNGQVGPGTIAGHNPPPGDHVNIVHGSIAAADLAQGAVIAGRLAPNSVSTANIINGSLGARDVDPSSIQRRVTGTC